MVVILEHSFQQGRVLPASILRGPVYARLAEVCQSLIRVPGNLAGIDKNQIAPGRYQVNAS